MNATTLRMPVSGILAHTPWRVDTIVDTDDFLRRCRQLEKRSGGSFFQHSSWLDSWYATLGAQPGVEPLLLTARPVGAPMDALLFPLVRRREGWLTVAECADGGITDYNAAIVRDGVQLSHGAARALWPQLRQALAGCDVLRLDKLAEHTGAGVPNPWMQMAATQPSELFGNRFTVHEDYADWMQHIGKHGRKEFERCWRVFSRLPDARFVMASTVDEGLALLRRLAALQHERQATTPGYRLAQPAYTAFYEHFLAEHLSSGRCVVTALMAGDEMAAGLFSVYDGRCFTMLRIAMGGEAWKACAPGKLLLERSIHAMHGRGCREFDFAIGDYQHKKVFRTTALPLHEAVVPLTLAGRGYHLAWRTRQALRRHEGLRQAWRRLRPTAGPG